MGSLLLALIYICFISLGLPDSLLGAAWPVLRVEIGAPLSYAGVVAMVICLGTIVSSLFSDKLLHRFGAGLVTAVSITTTAVALFGFSVSSKFWMLILWAIPYGLGAGGVDSILNNYVALRYKAQHMSWLHCMWGVGASISPYIMSFALIRLNDWSRGYLIVSVIQILLSVIIFTSIPLWKKGADKQEQCVAVKPLSFKQIFAVNGAIACFLTFFCYCALEVTTSLWASSYMVQRWQFNPEDGARCASMFYLGITFGRFLNGFLAMKLNDRFLIRMGICIITVGVILLLIPLHSSLALAGFIIIGLGCAPIYPCIIHMTPNVFGADKSQAMIGVQMAFAYTGFLIMPSLFGVIAENISISLLPVYQLVLLCVMAIMHERVLRRTSNKKLVL